MSPLPLPLGWIGRALWTDSFEDGVGGWTFEVATGRGSWQVERAGACGGALMLRMAGPGEARAQRGIARNSLPGSRFRWWVAGQGAGTASLVIQSGVLEKVLWSGVVSQGWQPVPRVAGPMDGRAMGDGLSWRVSAKGPLGIYLDDVSELAPDS